LLPIPLLEKGGGGEEKGAAHADAGAGGVRTTPLLLAVGWVLLAWLGRCARGREGGAPGGCAGGERRAAARAEPGSEG
jgi:hypothetical protein